MRVGLALGLGGLPLRESASVAREAEAAGVALLCVGEAGWDTFVTATSLAAATDRAQIVSSVATWVRPPVLTALSAATVDELSGGRYTLGLGPMSPAWNLDHYGIDPSRPLARMREYVSVVRGALGAHSGALLDHDGEFFTVRGYARRSPPLREDLPIHLGATRPGMARLAGEAADGVIYNFLHTRAWLAEVLDPALQEGCATAGRRVERAAMVRVLVEPHRPTARAVLRAGLAAYRQVPYLTEVAAAAGHAPDDDAFQDDSGVSGTAAGCVGELLQRYSDLVDWLELTPPSGLPPHRLRTAYGQLIDVACQVQRQSAAG